MPICSIARGIKRRTIQQLAPVSTQPGIAADFDLHRNQQFAYERAAGNITILTGTQNPAKIATRQDKKLPSICLKRFGSACSTGFSCWEFCHPSRRVARAGRTRRITLGFLGRSARMMHRGRYV
jgi:hypothetical protein